MLALTFAKYLIEHGADVNIKDSDNDDATLLILKTHYVTAAPKGYLMERYELLVKNGADVNAKDKMGKTALMGAARMQGKEHLQFFVENGADINAKDAEGNTVFMYVCCADFREKAEYLFGLGVDINAENNEGKTALMLAIESNNYEMAIFCLEHGAKTGQKYYIANPYQCTCKKRKDKNEEYLPFAGHLIKHGILTILEKDYRKNRPVCLCENDENYTVILPVEEGMQVKPITNFCVCENVD